LFDFASFVRVSAFALIYGGIEYRYVNRFEADWTREIEGFFEKPVFGVFTPYHVFLLLPLFVSVAFVLPITAWAGNCFLVGLVEDIAYFGWRGKWVVKDEWTTKILGSFGWGRLVVPAWWPLSFVLLVFLYLVPL
jgi:hypothetical protein